MSKPTKVKASPQRKRRSRKRASQGTNQLITPSWILDDYFRICAERIKNVRDLNREFGRG